MNLFKYLTGRKDELYVTAPGKLPIPLRNVGKADKSGTAVPYEQAVKFDADGATQSSDIAFTGENTHSGVETFSNATGATTDTITPRTSGGGTSVLRPAGVVTTTPLTAIKSGGVYGLSKADGLAVTLPALSTALIGTTFRFHILTSCTSVGYVFTTSNVMIGGLWATIANPDAANDMEFNIASSTNNTLTLGATTACGLAGGYIDFTAISATQWAVSGTVLGSGTLASNLFTTV
ncbi:MAG: hypothetical protein IT212_07625 [Bacteroidia bacterium]|nr:hypothetical protein [Bacteroidia bacterium]